MSSLELGSLPTGNRVAAIVHSLQPEHRGLEKRHVLWAGNQQPDELKDLTETTRSSFQ